MVERMLYHYDRNYCVHSELMIGVADCLHALRDRGLPMAVCTNKDQVIARKIVRALGIEPYVTVTVGPQASGLRVGREIKEMSHGWETLECPDQVEVEEYSKLLNRVQLHKWNVGVTASTLTVTRPTSSSLLPG